MVDNVNYRIENLELRLPKIPNNSEGSSALREIVKWQKDESKKIGEFCYTIAIFKYDNLGYPELRFVGNRPTELNKKEFDIFNILLKEGYKYAINYEEFKYYKIQDI